MIIVWISQDWFIKWNIIDPTLSPKIINKSRVTKPCFNQILSKSIMSRQFLKLVSWERTCEKRIYNSNHVGVGLDFFSGVDYANIVRLKGRQDSKIIPKPF